MKVALAASDLHLLEMIDAAELGELGAHNIQQAAEGAHELAKIYQEVTHRGRHTGAAGFDSGFFFQHVASIPQSVIAALVLIDPEIMIVKPKFYAWLAGPGKPWDLRRRTVKGAM